MNIIFDIEKELDKFGLTPEKYEQLLHDCSAKVQKISDVEWQEIVDKYNLGVHYDTLRKSCQFITGGAFVAEYYKWRDSLDKANTDSDYASELKEQRRELQKERIKFSTEKLEYNKWLRELARDELVIEKMCESISKIQPITPPSYIEPTQNPKSYCLAFGDEHYGAEFEIKDLWGGIINAYSPEIFEQRMWTMLNKTVEIIKKENVGVLNVCSLGDFADGILRVSQLSQLRCGVVDGTIQYANFIANWLNELTKYVRVIYQMTDGNHTELRQLGQPKGTFTEDNMGKIVREFIKARLADNKNFQLVENPTGYICRDFSNNVVLGIHGEVKNMDRAIKEFSSIYNTPIDYLMSGHLHHSKFEDIGINKAVINIPSVVGTTPYSMSLQKTSSPAAKLLEFDSKDGLVCEYTLKL